MRRCEEIMEIISAASGAGTFTRETNKCRHRLHTLHKKQLKRITGLSVKLKTLTSGDTGEKGDDFGFGEDPLPATPGARAMSAVVGRPGFVRM